MFDTASASNGVKLALLEGQLLTREIDRATFIERAANLGLPAPASGDAADKFMAIAANQAGQHPSAVRDHRRALGRNPQRLILPIREAPPGNDDVSHFSRRKFSQ
jgi:hypothetical protein